MKKECILNKVYTSKHGELCLGIKFKFGDVNLAERDGMETFWREGTPLEIELPAVYQPDPSFYPQKNEEETRTNEESGQAL